MNAPQTGTPHLIHSYYAAFNSGDREAMLALLTHDVEHGINQGACEQGMEAFRAFLRHMDACYAEQVEELVVLSSTCGTRAAAEFYISGRYLATDSGLPPAAGQAYRLRVGAFFEIRDGRIARVTNYYNLQDWLRQVGAA